MAAVWRRSPELTRPIRFRLTPHEGQEEYLGLYHPIVLNISSNRNGKTTGGLMDDIWRAHGVHPYKNVPLADTIWVGFPDYPFFTKVTERIFLEIMPRYLLVDYNETKKRAKIRRVDGGLCYLYFVSYEQDPQSWAGAAVDHVHLDELPPEAHFRESAARVSTKAGTISITVTPAEGLGWMEEELYLPGKSRERPDVEVLEGGLAEYDEAKERQDPYTCGVGRLILPESHPMGRRENVEQFARSIKDPAERMIRVFGIYKKRSGGVYKAFDAQVHVISSFPIPDHWELVAGCDPGFNGFSLVLDAIDPMGRAFTFYEYFNQQGTHDQHVADVWTALAGDITVVHRCACGRPRHPYEEHCCAECASTRMRHIDTALGDRMPVPSPQHSHTCNERAGAGVAGGASPGLLPFLHVPDEEGNYRSVLIYVDTAAAQDVLELNAAAQRLDGCRLVFVQIDQKLKGVHAGIRHVEAMLEPSRKRARPTQVDRPQDYDLGEPAWYIFDTLYSEWMLPPKSGVVGDEGTPMSGSRLVWEIKNYKWKKPTINQAHAIEPDKASAGGAHVLDAKRYAAMARTAPPEERDAPEDETPQQRRARLHREKMAKKSQRRGRR